jgi:hypothetical protein
VLLVLLGYPKDSHFQTISNPFEQEEKQLNGRSTETPREKRNFVQTQKTT